MEAQGDRERLIEALLLDDFEHDRGSEVQLAAWRELEWRRCKEDVEYWMERYAYIIDEGRICKWHDPVDGRFLWEIQRWVLRDLQSHRSLCGVKARQLGITTTVGHFGLWDCIFHEAETWDEISSSEEKAKDILKRVQATKDRLPKWMLDRAQKRNTLETGIAKRKDRSDSITRISFGLSEMKIVTSTVKSVQGASNNINLDEATLHVDLKKKLQQMMATLDGSGGVGAVIANGNGQDDFFWFYQAAKRGDNGFVPYFFWWGDDPSRLDGAILTMKDGTEVPAQSVPRHVLMHGAARGRLNAPWYETMKKRFLFENPEADEYAFRAIYPTTEQEAFYISASCRFPLGIVNGYADDIRNRNPEIIRGLLEFNAAGVVDVSPHSRGRWRIFEPPRPGFKYVIGGDSSGGSQAGDYATCQVLKLVGDKHLEQVATFQAKCEPVELAIEMKKAGHWYNDAYLVPEANNTGQVLVDHLKVDYVNVYVRRARIDKAYFNKPLDMLGFWTDKSTKPRLIANLAEKMAKSELFLNDSATVEELGHYEIKDDGVATGAPKGMNDDLVMALALAIEGAIEMTSFFVSAEVRTLMTWEE